MISPSRSNRKETTARTISFFAGILVVLTLLASACGDSAQPTPTPTPTPIPPTQTPIPTPTAVPTATPAPTATPEPTATPTPVPTPTVTPEPLPDSAAILEDGLQATRSLDSYAAEMEMSIAGSSGGISLEVPIGVDGAFKPPDRSKGKVTIDFGGFKFEFDFVNIGDDAYMTDPGSGMWMKDDTGSGDLDFFLIIDSLLDFDSDDSIDLFGNLDYIGVEDLDGIETHHIRASLSDAILEDLSPDPGEYAIDYWVGVDDGLVHKIIVHGETELLGEGDPDSLLGGFGSGSVEVNIELALDEFDVPVEIEAPEGAISLPPSLDQEDYEIEVEGTPLFEIEQGNGWVLYDMPTVGLAIAAPPSWSVYSYDEAGREKLSEDLKTRDPDLVAQIENIVQGFEGQISMMLLGLDIEPPAGSQFVSNFNIIVEDIGSELDLDTYADLSIQGIQAFLPVIGGVESERIEIPAGDAVVLKYLMDQQLIGGDAVQISVTQYLLINGSEGVVVTFTGPSEGMDDMSTLFGEMIETLELYPPLPFGQSTDPTSPETPTPQPTATPQEGQQMTKQYDSAPAMVIDTSKSYTATFAMDGGGEFKVKLFAQEAPRTVNNFVFLARDGYYDGVTFHRVIPGFMAQSGDPAGTGRGGPGYRFEDEFHPSLRHDKPGILSMANAGPNTNGSQFFITFIPTPHLDDAHAVFGEVIEGMDVVNSISTRDPSTASAPGDVITSITITEE